MSEGSVLSTVILTSLLAVGPDTGAISGVSVVAELDVAGTVVSEPDAENMKTVLTMNTNIVKLCCKK